LFQWLEQDTGRTPSAVELDWLDKQGWTKVALDAAESAGYEECLEALRELRETFKALAAESGTALLKKRGSEVAEVQLTGVATRAEAERSRIFTNWLAREASQSTMVSFIRQRLLGDAAPLATRNQVFDLLESPAAHFLEASFFQRHGVPIFGHRARVTARSFRDLEAGRVLAVELHVQWKGGAIRQGAMVASPAGRLGGQNRYVWFPSRDGELKAHLLHARSFKAQLEEACQQIADVFLWSRREAFWFLLAGEVPKAPAVRATRRVTRDAAGSPLHASIILRASPFVSADSVARAFRRAKQELLRRPQARPVALKTLKLFEFVESQSSPASKERPWAALMRAWDASVQQGWRYADRRHFRRDYLRAKKLITEPGYHRGRAKGSDSKRA
jgi:hypothetical protein